MTIALLTLVSLSINLTVRPSFFEKCNFKLVVRVRTLSSCCLTK